MTQTNKRRSYKDYAKRAYSYYKKYGVFGSVGNFWRWLLDRPERVTALSNFAMFLATAVAVGVGYAQWRELHDTDITLKETADATNRAYIAITGVKWDGWPEVDKNQRLKILFKNVGKE